MVELVGWRWFWMLGEDATVRVYWLIYFGRNWLTVFTRRSLPPARDLCSDSFLCLLLNRVSACRFSSLTSFSLSVHSLLPIPRLNLYVPDRAPIVCPLHLHVHVLPSMSATLLPPPLPLLLLISSKGLRSTGSDVAFIFGLYFHPPRDRFSVVRFSSFSV